MCAIVTGVQTCALPITRASSTAYWISGRSTTGSISLGIALVAGRKRVPSPATGKTALRIGFMDEGLEANARQGKDGGRSEKRRVGKECDSTGRYRCAPYH